MSNNISQIKVPVSPVIKTMGRKIIINKDASKTILLRCSKINPGYKDEVVYKGKSCDSNLQRDFPDLLIIHRVNTATESRSTIAKYTSDGRAVERTSVEIVKLIGQKNYDTVISALSSVENNEVGIRAILALLTVEKTETKPVEMDKVNVTSQTDESCRTLLMNMKQRNNKRVKRQFFKPYVVPKSDEIKRVVVDPQEFLKSNLKLCNEKQKNIKWEQCSKKSISPPKTPNQEALPELKEFFNEDSNFSVGSVGNISLTSQHSLNIPELLVNPSHLVDFVEQHTRPSIDVPNTVPLPLSDGTTVMVCSKPIDKFHWASPDILFNLTEEQRNKLHCKQVCIDWNYCMEMDEDGYLPIHQAVLANDVEFLKRQCMVLKKKHGSVDFTANGNMTALQMSINKDGEACTSLLLQYGADPLLQDDEGKSFFHTASEVSHEHLRIALEYCKSNARQILKDDEKLWNPEMEEQSDEELSKFLLDTICLMVDDAGYTPLMLASKQGNFRTTKLLVEASPDTINRPMPSSGNTALYLAVGAAYAEVSESMNHTKIPEHYMKTIEILIENGADPNIENHANSSVNVLLTEFNIVDLSVLVANTIASVKYFDDKIFAKNNLNSYMLLKNSDGKVNLTKISNKQHNDDKVYQGPCNDKQNTPDKHTDDNKTNVSRESTINDNLNASNRIIATNKNVSVGKKFKNSTKSTNNEAKTKVTKNTVKKVTKSSNKKLVSSKNTNTDAGQLTKQVEYQIKTTVQTDIPKYVKILPKPEKPIVVSKKRKVNEGTQTDNGKKIKRTPLILRATTKIKKAEPSNAKEETKPNTDINDTKSKEVNIAPKPPPKPRTPNLVLKIQKAALKPIQTVKLVIGKATDQANLKKDNPAIIMRKDDVSKSTNVATPDILRLVLLNPTKDSNSVS